MEEIWKKIEGCSYYEVSNFGRVRSLDKVVPVINNGTPCTQFNKGIILKPVLIRQGYYAVSITFDSGIKKLVKIHRLVAQEFIPNPDKLPLVNHIDEVKTNNRVDNLEWCTHKYNSNYSDTGKKAGVKTRNRKDLSKVIQQYDLGGNFIAEYPSIKEAVRQTRICETCIINSCKGFYMKKGKKVNTNHAGGYKWKYKENS